MPQRKDDLEDWGSYRKLVISALERLTGELSKLNGKIDFLYADDLAKMKAEIAVLKVRAGLWGAAAGAVPAAIAVIYVMVTK